MQQLLLPPGELLDETRARVVHPLVEATGHQVTRVRKRTHERLDRAQVEMVVVVVADAHDVGARESARPVLVRHLLDSERRPTKTFRPEPLRWRRALTEHWIAQHADAVNVHENARVSNPNESQRTVEEAVPIGSSHR